MARRIEIQLYDHTTDAEIEEIMAELRALQLAHEPRLVDDAPVHMAANVRAIEALEGYVDVHGIRGFSVRADHGPDSLDRGGVLDMSEDACTCGGRGICTRCVLGQLRREEELRAEGFDPERADRTDSAV